MHDIYHLLEADRPDEPRQPIPAPVGERDKSDERYAPGHDPKAVDGDGVPVACSATAANVNDTIVFERLFLTAFAVMARIRAVFADKSYDAERHRNLCRQFGAEPHIHKRGQPHGSGLSKRRWPVERSNAWLL
jgi:transposase